MIYSILICFTLVNLIYNHTYICFVANQLSVYQICLSLLITAHSMVLQHQPIRPSYYSICLAMIWTYTFGSYYNNLLHCYSSLSLRNILVSYYCNTLAIPLYKRYRIIHIYDLFLLINSLVISFPLQYSWFIYLYLVLAVVLPFSYIFTHITYLTLYFSIASTT